MPIADSSATIQPAVLALIAWVLRNRSNHPNAMYACTDWNAKNSVTIHAVGLRTSAVAGNRVVPAVNRVSCRSVESHGSTATALSNAHEPIPARHESSPDARSPIGTDRPAASVPPIAIAVVYSAVICPMPSGKCHLTSVGINTLATADPITLSTLHAPNAATEPTTAPAR